MATLLRSTRKKLGLSQADFASLLGMSRPTLSKTEKGERKLTLEEKKKLASLITSLELEKQDHHMRVSIPQEDIKKFKQVLLYVLEQIGAKPNIGLTVLYKLLYFIDFDYYEKYGQQLMGLTYFKNTHGPTPRNFTKVVEKMKEDGELVEVKSKYFKHDQKKFLPHIKPDLSLLDGRELEMIDDVLRRYSDKSARQLSVMSHRDMPWKATQKGEDIDYELVFYRSDEFSVGEYSPL